MTERHRRGRLIASAAALLVLATACGGSAGGAPSAGQKPTAPPTAEPTELAPTQLATAHAKLGDLQKAAQTRPVQVQVPGYPATAPVLERTADPVSGGLDLPENPGEVAWWSAGALPGDGKGNVVLASHISYNGHYGPFTRLTSLRRGQLIRVHTAAGAWLSYTVTSTRQFAKHVLDRQGLFSTTGPAQLILVTCGGKYDPTTHNYADNVVVTATPTS